MNETFSINRFRLLVRRQWAENKKVYLLLWGVVSLAIVINAIFGSEKYEALFVNILLLCFGGCVMVPTFYNRWSDFGRSSFFLLLPASVTEKFLCGLFYGFILFIPVYCVNYFISTYIFAYLAISIFPNNLLPFSDEIKGGLNEIGYIPFNTYIVILLAFLFAQSLFMIISVQFKKRQALIFVLTMMAVLLLYNWGINALMSKILNLHWKAFRAPGPFLAFYSPDFGYGKSLHVTGDFEYFSFIKLIKNVNFLVWFIVFSILYLTTWFRLKEREL